MKKLFIIFAFLVTLSFHSFAQMSFGNYPSTNSYSTPQSYTVPSTNSSGVRYQQPYVRNDGTYVNGHYKTHSNQTNHDNFSTQGNVNIYTGASGSRARDYSPNAYNYGTGHTIHTGSRGGQYYINSNGNKTYVPKR